MSPTNDSPLTQEVLARLSADPKTDAERDMLVLAALEGAAALAGYLTAARSRTAPTRRLPTQHRPVSRSAPT